MDKLRIMRVKNPAGIDFIKGMLLPDEDVPTDNFVEFLKEALKQASQATLILMIVDPTELDDERILKGILVAFAEANQPYVYVSQLHLVENIPEEHVADEMYLCLTTWAENLQRKELRMKTNRDPRGWTRRFGFEPLYTCMRRRLDEAFEITVAKRIKTLQESEAQDVQGRTEDSEFIDRKSTEHSGSDLGIPSPREPGAKVQSASGPVTEPVQDRPGSNTVPGPASGSAGPPVPAGIQPDLSSVADEIRKRNDVSSELPA